MYVIDKNRKDLGFLTGIPRVSSVILLHAVSLESTGYLLFGYFRKEAVVLLGGPGGGHPYPGTVWTRIAVTEVRATWEKLAEGIHMLLIPFPTDQLTKFLSLPFDINSQEHVLQCCNVFIVIYHI